MALLYASTFTDALAKLNGAEQKQVKLTAFDLQMDLRGNGLQMHRIEKSPGFWSARVSGDIRIILYKEDETTLLAYVDHHDAAYRWAERKRLVTHERTGAMQFVEVPVIVAEAPEVVVTPAPVAAPRLLFAALSDDQMLDVGVPRDWLEIARATPEGELFNLLEKLPAEAAEALLDYATGGLLENHIARKVEGANPFTHPDAQRRFRVVENLEELKAALDQPFEKWAVFLHPAQRDLVEREWSGPVRISGSAGTGKTIVALHRAAYLAKARGRKVLLTTFSAPLAQALAKKRDILAEADSKLQEQLTVSTLDQVVLDLYAAQFGSPKVADKENVRTAIKTAQSQGLGKSLTPEFLLEEWDELVDAWNVASGEAYARIPRLGRRTRLGASQREAAWSVFSFVQRHLAENQLLTWAQLYARLGEWTAAGEGRFPYAHVVVDEAQDLSVAQARFLASIGWQGKETLYFTGDQGQRIFHLPFSWSSLGIDIRGRSQSLKVNYRTSHQIRSAADRLLPAALVDVDGIEEGRRGTVSVFNGPEPLIVLARDETEEATKVGAYLASCLADGMVPSDLAILVRSHGQLSRARAAADKAGAESAPTPGIKIASMHDAKGLEFRAVAVMACDDDIIPDGERIASIGDQAELEAVYESERHLLYVACTRPRDRLMISAIKPGSEFLGDLVDCGSK